MRRVYPNVFSIIACLFLLTATVPAFAQDPNGVSLTVSTSPSSLTTFPGNTLTAGASAAVNWPALASNETIDSTSVTYTWTTPTTYGTLSPTNESSTTDTLTVNEPSNSAPYTETISCSASYSMTYTVTYTTWDPTTQTLTPHSQDTTVTGTVTGSATLPVTVEGKTWDPGDPISGGVMTAPQDQTNPASPSPSTIVAAAGASLSCSVTPASDSDHWVYSGFETQTGGSGTASDTVTQTWTCSSGQFQTGTDGSGNPTYAHSVVGTSATWVAPSSSGDYTITCTSDDAGGPVVAPDTGSRKDTAMVATCTVVVPEFQIEVSRHNSGDSYGTSTTVAAGGLSSDEHKADVQITATDSATGATLVGAPIPSIGVSTGSGIVTLASAPSTTGAVSGAGGVWTGIFTSGDLTTDVTLTCGANTATVTQTWDDGDPGNWNPDVSSLQVDYDVPFPITFSPVFDDDGVNVPIQGHSIEMEFISMNAYIWDSSEDDYDYETDLPPDPLLLWFSGNTPPDVGGGTYPASLNIDFDPNTVIDYATFDAFDDGVYVPGSGD